MPRLKHLSPIRAVRDLRFFLATRKRHELLFMALSLLVTSTIVFMLFKDAQFARPYKPNIIYVESWPANRSDEEIRAQQVIDQAAKEKAEAEWEARQKKRQAEFKKVDDWLTNHGI